MGSTRVIIPDRPGASEHIQRIEEAAESHEHRSLVRPVGGEWVIVIEGDGTNDEIADLYTAYVRLTIAGDDARVAREP